MMKGMKRMKHQHKWPSLSQGGAVEGAVQLYCCVNGKTF